MKIHTWWLNFQINKNVILFIVSYSALDERVVQLRHEPSGAERLATVVPGKMLHKTAVNHKRRWKDTNTKVSR